MRKRGSLLVVAFAAALLLSLLLGSVGVSASLFGCDEDADCSDNWEVTSDGSGCKYSFECVGDWFSSSCQNPSTQTCTYSVGYTYEWLGNGYTVICNSGGCAYPKSYDCNQYDGCSNNLYDGYSFTGYSLSTYKCEKTTSCLDSCCPTGQKCDGGVCKVPPDPCLESGADADGDGYKSSSYKGKSCGTDCNDANSAVWHYLSGYVDADKDGYGTGSAVSVCSGSSLPSGYASAGGDCNDANRDVHSNNACGVCAAEPAVRPNTRCEAGVGACYRVGSYFCSADGTTTSCSVTAGSPSVEACSDGVDNDCDGWSDCYDGDCADYSPCADTPLVCDNDGTCETGETAQSCAADCTRCSDGLVTGSEQCEPPQTQSVCGGSRTQTCNPSTCQWNSVTCPCTSNSECGVASAPACSGSLTIDRTVAGYCNSGTCQYSFSCVSGSCGASCSVGTAQHGSCALGQRQTCGSGCGWNACATCTDSDGDGFYVESLCGAGVDCNDGSAALTTSCGGSAPVQGSGSCSDGVRNGDETGIDCGGRCLSSAVEVCGDGVDNDKDCSVDEGCSGDVCSGVADEDASKACCLGRGHCWGKSGELAKPLTTVVSDISRSSSSTFRPSAGLSDFYVFSLTPYASGLEAADGFYIVYSHNGGVYYYFYDKSLRQVVAPKLIGYSGLENTEDVNGYGASFAAAIDSTGALVVGYMQGDRVTAPTFVVREVRGSVVGPEQSVSTDIFDGNGIFMAAGRDGRVFAVVNGFWYDQGITTLLTRNNGVWSRTGWRGGSNFVAKAIGVDSAGSAVMIHGDSTGRLYYDTSANGYGPGRNERTIGLGRVGSANGFRVEPDGFIVVGSDRTAKFDSTGRVVWEVSVAGAYTVVRPMRVTPASDVSAWAVSQFVLFDGYTAPGVSLNNGPVRLVQVGVASDSTHEDNQFVDSAGRRKASRRLLPDEEQCVGDDAGEEFFCQSRRCNGADCLTDVSDVAVCDKPSDCVFQGRCYSDIDDVSSTFFGNDRVGAWKSSAWKGELTADVDRDGSFEICDPGQWFEPSGSITGVVRDGLGAGVEGALVAASGPGSFSATSGAGGSYVISNVQPVPRNYGLTASKAGYNPDAYLNVNVVPVQPTLQDFVLQTATATVSGVVRNVSGLPVQGVVVRVLGSALSAVSGVDGSYSISGVRPGFYDLAAGKDSDGYGDSLVFNRQVVAPETAADFVLLKALEGCSDDCTRIGGNLCDAGCHGKGSCWFYSGETKQACDGTFGIIGLAGGRQVGCCEGRPYTPIKADVIVKAKQLIKTVKPVVYQGKLVKLVTLVFTPEK